MTTYQFDQCFNDKKVIKECNDEGHCKALRLQKELVDVQDPELLRSLMQRPNPLITIDRALPHEHSAFIPEFNPGVIVVAFCRHIDTTKTTLKTLTTKDAAKILAKFKAQFVEWHEAVVSNSIVEITDIAVEVSHVEDGKLVRDLRVEFSHGNWQTNLFKVLEQNSLKTKPTLPPPATFPV